MSGWPARPPAAEARVARGCRRCGTGSGASSIAPSRPCVRGSGPIAAISSSLMPETRKRREAAGAVRDAERRVARAAELARARRRAAAARPRPSAATATASTASLTARSAGPRPYHRCSAPRRDRTTGVRLPDPCLVVLVGATAAGKSDWAAQWFHPDQVVSSDRLRAVVGTGERDQRASRDAFEVLDLIVAKRLQRGADDGDRHDRARGQAARGAGGRSPQRHGVPAHAVLFDTPATEVRAAQPRPRDARPRRTSSTAQLREADGVAERARRRGLRRRPPRRPGRRSCRPPS